MLRQNPPNYTSLKNEDWQNLRQNPTQKEQENFAKAWASSTTLANFVFFFDDKINLV